MSVIVKGMRMPEGCQESVNGKYKYCPFVNTDDDCVLQRDKCFGTWEEQYAGCPLVELPEKHGRLIDADALKKEFPKDTDWEYPVNTNEYICETIDNAKTVIEAEGE